MNLCDLVRRKQPPVPWEEGEKIPWNEPGFSQRMLNEHLSQTHDLASRRAEIIDRQVSWIHNVVLQGRPACIVDLGCGPGLYTQRLARLGHACTGVDFGPASIAYARQQAAVDGLPCRYIEADMRQVSSLDIDRADLIMLIYGELNVFRSEDALHILQGARRLLNPGGQLLLEPHTFDAVRDWGNEPAAWTSAESGLFSDRPHLMLVEHAWEKASSLATGRHFLIDAASSEVTRYTSSMQAYSDEDYARLLRDAGFCMATRYASLGDDERTVQPGLFALLAPVEDVTRVHGAPTRHAFLT